MHIVAPDQLKRLVLVPGVVAVVMTVPAELQL